MEVEMPHRPVNEPPSLTVLAVPNFALLYKLTFQYYV